MALITIITITYNAEKVLERTLQSIAKQECKNFEYLLIDGQSKDGTLQLANKYRGLITSIVSEKDNGIYDAMNKGLAMAKGEFVWFMNAGDEIADESTMCKIIANIHSDCDLIYGDAWFVNESGEIRGKRSDLTPHKLKANMTWKDLKYGMLVCHQSLIVRRSIAPAYIENNLSADIDWEIKSFKKAKKAVFLNYPIAKYLEGGISNQNLTKSLIDRYNVLKNHFGFFPNIYNHLVVLFRGIFKIAQNRGKYW
ncbi:glycosyltransferase family 2 protein [Jiulongibacter sediminis]|uniref:Glycosyl transferase family 2 n=1 Tax=Jiulongibacter sediminis TaxID=1605367 RepID=A0A0P7BEV3_9BACT|nr:glycosyltransferase family 2 protein [Jiulongibacter sediminis]KPM49335.1 glycosyl transferase family 2 [Jiulongibacter sediminis]TBX26387.1 glycosyl transferase family 2 [Jiulongibacter sediminis]